MKAFFSPFPNYDVVDNNMAETFNSYIIRARDKPVINMFEDIRRTIMIRMAKKREKIDK